jgi:uncharacterized small protein (DUF1192 family)
MMLKKMNPFVILIAAVLLYSCGSTNNLSDYKLNEETVFFDEIVAMTSAQVEIVHNNNNKTDKSDLDVLGDIAASIGKAVLTSGAEEKLRNAAKPRLVVEDISYGVEQALVKYLMIKPTKVLDMDARFIVNTTLEELKILSTTNGVYMRCKATVSITDRQTGGLVWENTEAENVPIRKTYGSSNATAATIAQAADLASLSEEEMEQAVESASNEVGRLMAETLRKDISEAAKK